VGKLVATSRAEQGQAAVDPWTLVHLAAGLSLGLLNAGPKATAGLVLGFEVIEQGLQRSEAGKAVFAEGGPESLPNVGVDLAVTALGWWLGRTWRRR